VPIDGPAVRRTAGVSALPADRDPAPTPRTVRCPTCSGASVFSPANAYRPFCSERCRRIDLGAWASERFRVAENAAPRDDEAADAGSAD
jgi:endogenous inhibitor of DNA gyrase (YacG/DUF329 family)